MKNAMPVNYCIRSVVTDDACATGGASGSQGDPVTVSQSVGGVNLPLDYLSEAEPNQPTNKFLQHTQAGAHSQLQLSKTLQYIHACAPGIKVV